MPGLGLGIPDNAIDLTPLPPEFEALVADTLGDAGGERDGFDGLFGDVLHGLSDAGNVLTALAGHADEVGTISAEMAAPIEADAVSTLAHTIDAGQDTFTTYGLDLSGEQPTPTPGPTPALEVTPATLNFGNVRIGFDSAPMKITLKNASDKPVKLVAAPPPPPPGDGGGGGGGGGGGSGECRWIGAITHDAAGNVRILWFLTCT